MHQIRIPNAIKYKNGFFKNLKASLEHRVIVYFFNSREDKAGEVWIFFFSNPQYKLDECISLSTDFSSTLLNAVDKVWRISLTKTSDYL